jgi:hypothetical protein
MMHHLAQLMTHRRAMTMGRHPLDGLLMSQMGHWKQQKQQATVPSQAQQKRPLLLQQQHKRPTQVTTPAAAAAAAAAAARMVSQIPGILIT